MQSAKYHGCFVTALFVFALIPAAKAQQTVTVVVRKDSVCSIAEPLNHAAIFSSRYS